MGLGRTKEICKIHVHSVNSETLATDVRLFRFLFLSSSTSSSFWQCLFALFEISLQLSIDFCKTFMLEDNLKLSMTEQQKRLAKFTD